MFFIDDDLNEEYLPIKIYELLIGDDVQNWFDWFFQYPLTCPCCMCAFSLVFIDYDNFGVNIFSDHKGYF